MPASWTHAQAALPDALNFFEVGLRQLTDAQGLALIDDLPCLLLELRQPTAPGQQLLSLLSQPDSLSSHAIALGLNFRLLLPHLLDPFGLLTWAGFDNLIESKYLVRGVFNIRN